MNEQGAQAGYLTGLCITALLGCPECDTWLWHEPGSYARPQQTDPPGGLGQVQVPLGFSWSHVPHRSLDG